MRPLNLTIDPTDREIVDDKQGSLSDFTYLVFCHLSMLIYCSRQNTRRIARSEWQFGYHQHLPGVVESEARTEVPFIRVKRYWKECMCHFTGLHLAVPFHYLARNVTAAYAHWWHKVAGATCAVLHISGLPIAPNEESSSFGLGSTWGSAFVPGVSISGQKEERREEIP